MGNKKKRKNNTNKKSSTKKELVKPIGAFDKFMSNNIARVAVHLITIGIWIFFLSDFFAYKNTKGYPNPFLSVLALATLILEYSYYNKKSKKK